MNQDEIQTLVPCLLCKGRGRIAGRTCDDCAGTKLVTVETQSRQRLRWPEKNHA